VAEGKAGWTINYEIAALLQILKRHGLWSALSDRVKFLRERNGVGCAIPRDQESKLIGAISKLRSPAVIPVFVLAVDTGLRASEIRSLRRKDLAVEWRDGVITA